MKNFFALLEELCVAIAFAEAGEYDTLGDENIQPRDHGCVRMHSQA